MSARHPLPPYGKRLLEDRRANRPVNCFVYAGRRAHELARLKLHALAVPNDVAWRALDWSLIAGLGVTLVSRGWSTAETGELARHLVRSGAALVAGITVTIDSKIPQVETTYFRPARRAAVAA